MTLAVVTKAKDGRKFTRQIELKKDEIERDMKRFVKTIKENDEVVEKVLFLSKPMNQW